MFTYTLTNKTIPHIATYLSQLQEISPSVIGVSVGNSLVIESTQELYSGALALLDAVTPANEPTIRLVEKSIEAAIQFGQSLIINFAAENVLLGITQEGQTATVLNKMSAVIPALQAGSLYAAMDAMRAIPETDYDSKYVTAARLLAGVNKIEAYLGLPISTEL